MSTQYLLEVTNNSTQYQDFCLYQNPANVGVPNPFALAWLVTPAPPNTTVTFKWTENYSFVWAQTGTLVPGAMVHAQQTIPADPGDPSNNQIQFDYRDGAFGFVFGPVSGSPQFGSLGIRELSGIPPNTASVGIGMADAALFVVPALPNENLVFTPHPEYWITAGTFSQGLVLNTEEITNAAPVDFDGTFTRHAVLNANNSWTVS